MPSLVPDLNHGCEYAWSSGKDTLILDLPSEPNALERCWWRERLMKAEVANPQQLLPAIDERSSRC
jgi:hypothetical protein